MKSNPFTKYLKKEDPDKAHAVFSASGADRWLGCPGSIRMSAGIPSVPNRASIRGTHTHTLLQFLLEHPKHHYLLGAVDSREFRTEIEYDAAMRENAMFAFQTVQKEIDRMTLKYGMRPEIFTEVKVELKGVGFGTSDVILYHPFGELIVIDYKNGMKTVEPENNPQGLYYAVAAADRFGWEFSDLTIMIIQPNAPHRDGYVRRWKTDYKTLERWNTKFQNGAVLAKREDAPLVKNDAWCWFCPARQVCPEHQDQRARKLFEKMKQYEDVYD